MGSNRSCLTGVCDLQGSAPSIPRAAHVPGRPWTESGHGTEVRRLGRTPQSAPFAHGTTRASPAVRHVALAAAGLEAPHHVGTGTLAGGWRALALLHHHTRLVVGDGHVAVDGDQVVWGPAVAAARLVHLKSERRGARVLAALDLGARRRQSGVAEAVLRAVLHVKIHLLWAVLGDLDRDGRSRERQAHHGSLHCNQILMGLRWC